MPVSDLLPYLLPVISALLGGSVGGVVGGFAGAYANGRVRRKEEEEARDRERDGLLRLIDAEVYFNESQLRQFAENPVFLHTAKVSSLRTTYWDSANARLAQLLAEEHFKAASAYYLHIYVTKDATEDERRGASDSILRNVDQVIAVGRSVREHGQRYLKRPDHIAKRDKDALPQP